MHSFCGLKAADFADKKANFHTHTTRCHHAVGEDREYVEKAIEAGFRVLGFSDHGPVVREDGRVSPVRMLPEELDGYVSSILDLRKEYQDDIDLYIGLEVENMPSFFEKTVEFYRQYPLDYLILGQHFFGDEGATPHVARPQEDPACIERYVHAVTTALDTDLFFYVAHPDIFRFAGEENLYWEGMGKILDKLKEKNLPVEINGNGFRENLHYPNPRFAKMAADKGCSFIIGVDAHNPENLTNLAAMEGCADFVKKVGGKLICS